MTTTTTVSVVVPTRDRPEALDRCLAALAMQTAPWLEVVVVDDGSAEAARIARSAARAGATYVRRQGDGPSAARNAGVAAATGTVVCFTDDDCEPTPRWAELLAEAVVGGAAYAGGRTRNPGDASACDRAAEHVTGHLREHTFAHSPATAFVASNNLACLRSTALAVPFDEAYGVGGEDRDWCRRVATTIGPPTLVPDAVVVHSPRLTLRRFWRQQVRYGRGAHRFAGGVPTPAGVAFHVSLLARGMRSGPLVGALVLASQLATAVGVAGAERERRRARGR